VRMAKYNVVIIGGGITGVALAYMLAKRGVERVLVLERNYLGSGSSFKCAGGIRASFSSEEHVKLMLRSIELWHELSKQLGFYYEQSGYVWLLSTEEEFKHYRELARFHNTLGLTTRVINGERVSDLVPTISAEGLVGALFDPLAGKASPFETLYSLYLAAKKLGAEFWTGCGAEKILIDDGHVVGVKTGRGPIYCDAVVVAAGSETRRLLMGVGVDVPLEPVPRHALITEAYSEVFKPLVVDASEGAYAVQVKEGNFLLGADIEERKGAPLTVRADFPALVLKVWSRWFPWLLYTGILRYWSGYYVVTPDRHPVLGPVNKVEGIYVAAGFSGHGFMMAPVVAEELTNWIVKGKPQNTYACRLVLSRFAEGKLLSEKAVIG